MNGIVPLLSSFLYAAKEDARIGITHIGLYAALLQCWMEQGYPEPLILFSYEVRCVAKLSQNTYCRCMRQLDEYGYIHYVASYKHNKGSKIYFSQACTTEDSNDKKR